MELERIELQKKRLTADIIEPAKAKKEASELEAKGKAATIIADGDANIDVLKKKIEAYNSALGNGEKVFMLNMLPGIIEMLTSTVKDIKIDKISVIDSGGNNGSQLAKLVTQLPSSVVSLSEMIENATGIDILSTFKKAEVKD
jgi:flotillin